MGKWKDATVEHDEALVELAMLLTKAHSLVSDGKVSVAEFVGNLECAKHLALTEHHADEVPGVRVVHVGGEASLGELLASFFGSDDDDDEKGGDE